MSCANYGVAHSGNFIIVQDTDGEPLRRECVSSDSRGLRRNSQTARVGLAIRV